LVVLLFLSLVLLGPSDVFGYPVEPGRAAESAWLVAEPEGAPEAPWIEITGSSPSSLLLFWSHLIENDNYDLFRATRPYFQPEDVDANCIIAISAAGFGSGSVVEYIDDGIDRYAGDGSIGPVQIVGDSAHNYFWAAQGRSDGGSGVVNWVGEFDFALVKGG
jgi:hypothetical protein